MAIDVVRINGNVYSWSSAILKIDGERLHGWSEANFSHKRERSFGYGSSRRHGPRARTAGKYTPEPLKLKMEKSTADALRVTLAQRALDSRSYGNVEVPIQLQLIEGLLPVTTYEMQRCVVVAETPAVIEGVDQIGEEWEWQVFHYLVNGLSLADMTEG